MLSMKKLKLFSLIVAALSNGVSACTPGSRGYAQYDRNGKFLDANIVRFDGTSYWVEWVHNNSLCADTGYSLGNADICSRFSWQVKDFNGRVCGSSSGSGGSGGGSAGSSKEEDDGMGTFLTIGIVVISLGLAGCIFVTMCLRPESDEEAQARLEEGGRRFFKWSGTMSGSFSRSLSRSFSFKKMGSFFTRQAKYESRIAHIDDAPQVVKFVDSDNLVKKKSPAKTKTAPIPYKGANQGRAKRVTQQGTLEDTTFASPSADVFTSTRKPFNSRDDRRHTVF